MKSRADLDPAKDAPILLEIYQNEKTYLADMRLLDNIITKLLSINETNWPKEDRMVLESYQSAIKRLSKQPLISTLFEKCMELEDEIHRENNKLSENEFEKQMTDKLMNCLSDCRSLLHEDIQKNAASFYSNAAKAVKYQLIVNQIVTEREQADSMVKAEMDKFNNADNRKLKLDHYTGAQMQRPGRYKLYFDSLLKERVKIEFLVP